MKYLIKVLVFTILFFTIITLYNSVKAASLEFFPSATEVNVGETVKITLKVTAGGWNLYIKGAISDELVDNTSEKKNASWSQSYNFTPDSAGDYKITITGSITDYDSDDESEPINQTITITAKENQQSTEPEQPTNPEPERPTEPEPTFTDVNKTMYVNATSLNLRQSYNTSSTVLKSLKQNESVTVLAIGSNGWYKVRASDGTEGYVSGEYLTDTKPNQSSVTTLSSLTVSPGNLNETFSKDVLSYTMTVEADVDSITVTAVPTDSTAKVTVTGNTGLTAGTDNVINIRVMAENGSVRTYKIQVTKLATEDEDPNIIDEEPIEETKLGLSSLSIEGLKITPNFKSDVYEYTATLTDMSIEKLIVNAIASFEDAQVEITGADEIKLGENVITIIVTSADGEETVTYQIIVNKKEPTVVAKVEPKDNTNMFIAIAVSAAVVVLAIVTILIIKKVKSKPIRMYDDGDYNETEEENSTSSYNRYNKNSEEDNEEEYDEYEDEDDDDDDWGAPKKGFFNKFKKSGRHF